jgi:RND family efflux transporter MFP subunit
MLQQSSREGGTMNRIIRFLSVCATILFSLSLLVSCQKTEKKTEPVIRPVRYTRISSTGGTRLRTFSGVGDVVRKGQIIAALDPKDNEIEKQEAEASLARAQAEARNAAANYDRVRQLYENQNASRNDLDAARASAESAESERTKLDQARLTLSYTRLHAPVTGSIASVEVETNENVQKGQTVALLHSGSSIEVEVAIPESLISEIRKGSPVTVAFDALPGKEFSGTVTEVGVAAVQFATTYPVTVRLTGRNSEVRSGMTAEVTFRFESSDPRKRFLVPPVALGEDRAGRFLFVVEPADPGYGIVRRKEVTVGELTSRGIEVLSGLQDGDRVVTAGVGSLNDNTMVKLQNDKDGKK